MPASVLEFILDDSTASSTNFTTSDSFPRDDDSDHDALPSPSPLSTPILESRDPPSSSRKLAVAAIPPPLPTRSPLQHRHSSSHPLVYSFYLWLSNHDVDMNRLGLQRAMLALKGRALNGHQTRSQASLLAKVLVFGGNYKFSMEDRLRYAFATLICDAPHEDLGFRRSSSMEGGSYRRSSVVSRIDLEAMLSSDSYEQNSDDCSGCSSDSASSYFTAWDEDEIKHAGPQGKASGVLHLQSLKVLAAALKHILHCRESDSGSDDNTMNDSDSDESTTMHSNTTNQSTTRPIPLHDTIWRNIVHSLVHNLETNHNPDITGYSLSLLRLLQSIDPCVVTPLVQQTLFPRLLFLQEYGKQRQFPMIRVDVSRLLEGPKCCKKRYSCHGVEV